MTFKPNTMCKHINIALEKWSKIMLSSQSEKPSKITSMLVALVVTTFLQGKGTTSMQGNIKPRWWESQSRNKFLWFTYQSRHIRTICPEHGRDEVKNRSDHGYLPGQKFKYPECFPVQCMIGNREWFSLTQMWIHPEYTLNDFCILR